MMAEEGGARSGVMCKRVLTGILSTCTLLCLVVAFGWHTTSPQQKRFGLLMDILCCDGCCKALAPAMGSDTSFVGSSGEDSPGATVLHIDHTDEIDYTRNGHRVPEHMENALNEIDNVARRVKLALPKYLMESAAQREADLVNHKFSTDLQGVAEKHNTLMRTAAAAASNTTLGNSEKVASSVHLGFQNQGSQRLTTYASRKGSFTATFAANSAAQAPKAVHGAFTAHFVPEFNHQQHLATETDSAKSEGSGALTVLKGTRSKLNEALDRIDSLIGGYTGGASRHSAFFRHFDREQSTQQTAVLDVTDKALSAADKGTGGVLFKPTSPLHRHLNSIPAGLGTPTFR